MRSVLVHHRQKLLFHQIKQDKMQQTTKETILAQKQHNNKKKTPITAKKSKQNTPETNRQCFEFSINYIPIWPTLRRE